MLEKQAAKDSLLKPQMTAKKRATQTGSPKRFCASHSLPGLRVVAHLEEPVREHSHMVETPLRSCEGVWEACSSQEPWEVSNISISAHRAYAQMLST